MSEDLPEYFTAETLANHVGIKRRAFCLHKKYNIGQIQKAEEKIPGLGIRYKASACRKYIALVTAGREPRKQQTAAVS